MPNDETNKKIFKEIILRTPNDFANEKTALEKLVKMQHYGLPTRILDLTKNPLVALYFATKEIPKKNGEVIVFRIPKSDVKFYDSDTVSILSNIAKRPIEFGIDDIRSISNIEEFNVEVLNVMKNPGAGDLILVRTSGAVIDQTGGIVQGMSGSPILQDGRLVGAVTHVFVNDPDKGYGIFAENMLADFAEADAKTENPAA